MMNYSDILHALDKASAFDLYRLQMAIDNMIDDPKRIIEIKMALRLGQQIEHYDASSNRMEPAIVEKIKQTKAVVKNLNDGKRWQIPLCAINLQCRNTDIVQSQTEGLGKNELNVGDIVGFIDRSGTEQHGRVVRLNQKTATIESDNRGWRVSYELLHKVIDLDVSQVGCSDTYK